VARLGRLEILSAGLKKGRAKTAAGAGKSFRLSGGRGKMALSPRRATGTQRSSEIIISGMGVRVARRTVD